MPDRFIRPSAVIALATVEDLPAAARSAPDAERRASRIAVQRAVDGVGGDRGAVSVSLTHSDGRAAAIAAPAGTRVGIDLERAGAVDPAHRRLFLTPRERRFALAATVLWALKEAFWKAFRLDGSVGFHELEVDVEDGQVRGAWLRGSHHRAVATVSDPWLGYVMAVVRIEDGR